MHAATWADVHQCATHTATYTHEGERVGVEVAGRVMLVPAGRFGAVVGKIEARCGESH